MARIAGVDLPRQKRVDIALRYLFGFGPTRAVEVLHRAQVAPDLRVQALSEA